MRFLPAILVASVLIVSAACTGGGGAPPAPAATAELPQLALKSLGGESVPISGTPGQVRLLNFWATWCAPCREEIPTFKELEAKYGPKGFQIVGIAMDDEGESVVRPFVDKMEIRYLNLLGNEDVATKFNIVGYPTSILVNRDGKIVKSWPGLVPKNVLVKEIEALLAS